MNNLDLESLSNSNTRFIYKTQRSESFLTFLYFSKQNILNLQSLIRFLVHRETGITIDNQNSRELLIVMRNIFELYSRHPPYFDDSKGLEYNMSIVKKTKDEVSRLNQIVLNEIVPSVISMLLQYFGYLRDAEGRRFMEAPKNVNIAGQRSLRSVTSVLVGSSSPSGVQTPTPSEVALAPAGVETPAPSGVALAPAGVAPAPL